MKTSFYFFLWIIIYPLLGLFHNQWIYQNSFIVALFIVWGLSWFLNKNMPDTLRYEKMSGMVDILENVFTGNVKAFMKRLSRMVTIDFITAVYLGAAFVFVLFSMMRGSADDWIALAVFGFFAFGTLSRAVRLNNVYRQIKRTPTAEECAAVVDETFAVNYEEYYNTRILSSVDAMLPPQPRYFTAFQILSLIIAIVCALFGLFFLILSVIILSGNGGPAAISGGIMNLLYGSLATYFGIKDTIDCISYFKRSRKGITA